MAFKPVTDVAIAKLFRAVGGVLPYDTPITEQQETRRQQEAVLREIENFQETAKVVRLAKAIGLPVNETPNLSESELWRLYAAVR